MTRRDFLMAGATVLTVTALSRPVSALVIGASSPPQAREGGLAHDGLGESHVWIGEHRGHRLELVAEGPGRARLTLTTARYGTRVFDELGLRRGYADEHIRRAFSERVLREVRSTWRRIEEGAR